MQKTTFYITSWNKANALNVKNQLLAQGVPEEYIKYIEDRTSRSISLNKRILECQTPYIGFFDEDVMFSKNTVASLESVLDKYGNVGFVVAPVQQVQELRTPTPDADPSAPDDLCLEPISHKLWTFNASIYRKDCGIFMDEDFFGNQLLDWDFGLQLLKKGFLSVADHRTAVAHAQNDYSKKNLVYHAVVARSRDIFMRKWKDIDNWVSVDYYNSQSNNVIPSIEEITHASDEWLFKYVSLYDAFGLMDCWFKPRFGNSKAINNFINNFNKNNNKQIFNPQFTNDERVIEFK